MVECLDIFKPMRVKSAGIHNLEIKSYNNNIY